MAAFPAIDRNPAARKLRELALVFAVASVAFALHAWLVRARPELAMRGLALGALLAASTFVPRLGRWVYVAWMSLGAGLGRITGPVVLALVYFGVVTPLAALARLVGRDRLRRRKPQPTGSLWLKPEPKQKPEDYFRPF